MSSVKIVERERDGVVILDISGKCPEQELLDVIERRLKAGSRDFLLNLDIEALGSVYQAAGMVSKEGGCLKMVPPVPVEQWKKLMETIAADPKIDNETWFPGGRDFEACATEDEALVSFKLGKVSSVTENGGVELVRVPEGTFLMGSPDTEVGRGQYEGPQHEVTLPGFEIGRYAVTNEEYKRFLAANSDGAKPSYWDLRSPPARQPVHGVTREVAKAFAQWAGCRLASEAEWEYAARAGTKEPFLAGASEEDLDRFAWYHKNSEVRTHSVGEKEPNAWGLYDVLGNVQEIVEDDWHNSYHGAPRDGQPWTDAPRSPWGVTRSGRWSDSAFPNRVAYRIYFSGLGDAGFRVARSLE